MKKLLFAFLGVFLVASLISGCETVQGLKKDAQFAVKTAKKALFSQDEGASPTPSMQCEPIYKREKLSSSYRACLGEQVEASLSSEDIDRLYYGKAFPKCQKIYGDPKADWQKYRKCQGDEWVRTEVNRLVQWRADMARRDAAHQPQPAGARKSI